MPHAGMWCVDGKSGKQMVYTTARLFTPARLQQTRTASVRVPTVGIAITILPFHSSAAFAVPNQSRPRLTSYYLQLHCLQSISNNQAQNTVC